MKSKLIGLVDRGLLGVCSESSGEHLLAALFIPHGDAGLVSSTLQLSNIALVVQRTRGRTANGFEVVLAYAKCNLSAFVAY